MKTTIVKVICFILLIPVLGIGLPFGCAYLYGRIRYIEKKTVVESILERKEDALLKIVQGDNAVAEQLSAFGFESFVRDRHRHYVLFQFPYNGKLGGWVPCGLMYAPEPEKIEEWIMVSNIRNDWFFCWEPS